MFLVRFGNARAPGMDIEREINDLKRRVGDLEGAVNVLAGQFSNLHPEIVSFRDHSSQRFDDIDTTMQRCVKRLDTMNTQVWSLRDDLPVLVGNAVRSSMGIAAKE